MVVCLYNAYNFGGVKFMHHDTINELARARYEMILGRKRLARELWRRYPNNVAFSEEYRFWRAVVQLSGKISGELKRPVVAAWELQQRLNRKSF